VAVQIEGEDLRPGRENLLEQPAEGEERVVTRPVRDQHERVGPTCRRESIGHRIATGFRTPIHQSFMSHPTFVHPLPERTLVAEFLHELTC
jgi:hypothetical protein